MHEIITIKSFKDIDEKYKNNEIYFIYEKDTPAEQLADYFLNRGIIEKKVVTLGTLKKRIYHLLSEMELPNIFEDSELNKKMIKHSRKIISNKTITIPNDEVKEDNDITPAEEIKEAKKESTSTGVFNLIKKKIMKIWEDINLVKTLSK